MDFQKEVMRKEAEKNKECMAKREAEEAENARAFAEGKIPNEKWSIRIGSLGISEEVHTQAFVDRIIVPESEGSVFPKYTFSHVKFGSLFALYFPQMQDIISIVQLIGQ